MRRKLRRMRQAVFDGPVVVYLVLTALAPAGSAAGPATAANETAFPAQRFAPAQTSVVTEVVDGDTVVLASGEEVRLVGIQAPKLPLARPGFEKWPLADEAKDFTARLLLGRAVVLYHTGRSVDRHDRLLGHLVTRDGKWAQAAILRAGLARVYSFADNRALIAQMLAIESRARKVRRGIWNEPWYAVKPADDPDSIGLGFQIVEGVVLDVAAPRRNIYLNFGPDWRSDFTARIGPDAHTLFKRAGIEVISFQGERVRVRGWIRLNNGPLIEVTHPEQIEFSYER